MFRRADSSGEPVEPSDEFKEFFEGFHRRLWQSVVATFGPELADEATADTWAYAWRNWSRITEMANPQGYLYVAAKRYALSSNRRPALALPLPSPAELPAVEPGLVAAMNQLSEMQRTCVFLNVACQWRQREISELLEISESTVRNHLGRGLARLRSEMKVEAHVDD